MDLSTVSTVSTTLQLTATAMTKPLEELLSTEDFEEAAKNCAVATVDRKRKLTGEEMCRVTDTFSNFFVKVMGWEAC